MSRWAPAAAEWRPVRKSLLASIALTLLLLARVTEAAPSKVAHTPTPTPAVVPVGKETNAAAKYLDLYVLPLKIDAVTLVSSWTPCAPLPGYAQLPGNGNLLGRDAHPVGFCGIASVRLKKTDAKANVAGKKIEIQVSEQHYQHHAVGDDCGLLHFAVPRLG